jgi:hypothetical protein
MPKYHPIRRSHLIAPNCVGALHVAREGLTLMCAGLDHWFPQSEVLPDVDEFKFSEWRLEKRLNVHHLRFPPHTPEGLKNSDETEFPVPFFRFPLWHVCPSCKYMEALPETFGGHRLCQHCQRKQKRVHLNQVPWIAMCKQGHIQDFPWQEWVHKSATPTCNQPMQLFGTGRGGTSGLRVKCDCGASRSLSGITSADESGTYLSNHLSSEGKYLCRGHRSWLGKGNNESCTEPLRASPRNASNVTFAQTMSSLYIPQGDETLEELVELLRDPKIQRVISVLPPDDQKILLSVVRAQMNAETPFFSDEQIMKALKQLKKPEAEIISTDAEETSFRYDEFRVIRQSQEREFLSVRRADLANHPQLGTYVSNVTLLEKVTETRVLLGFTRVSPHVEADSEKERVEKLQRSLWKQLPERERWLPAIRIYGEGFFLELNEEILQNWEKRDDVKARVSSVVKRAQNTMSYSRSSAEINARFILLHTLAHLLINQLTFSAGYSTASLRERLYASRQEKTLMAGLLIYTAAGDSEGTLGGLVRLGKPKNLELVLRQALEHARWCSSDPVCIESKGQGLHSLNLGACHHCSLLPETSCEEFNRFLDRGLVIGILENPSLGFFHDYE